MLEKEIQGVITRRLKKMGAFVHKISDMSLGYKPFDFFGIFRGVSFYIELKKVKEGKTLPLSQIRENQKASLFKIQENTIGCVLSGVAIGVIDDKDKIKKICLIETQELEQKINDCKKSFTWEEIDNAPCLFDSIIYRTTYL